MATPRLIVVSAPSGTGKTTLCNRLLQDFAHLKLSVSTTTRKPRGQEKHGVEYFFTDADRFKELQAKGEFAESAEVHGNFYGTSKDFIRSTFAGGHSILLEIDVQGAAQLRKSYPKETYTIFIAPPSLDELEKRLRSRGTESEEQVQRRLKNARDEMAESVEYHCTIVNDELDRAYDQLRRVVLREIGPGLDPKSGAR